MKITTSITTGITTEVITITGIIISTAGITIHGIHKVIGDLP